MTTERIHPGSHLESVRVSRRNRRCESCRGLIAAGERYVRLSLPPGSDFGSDLHWWSVVVHIECPSVR